MRFVPIGGAIAIIACCCQGSKVIPPAGYEDSLVSTTTNSRWKRVASIGYVELPLERVSGLEWQALLAKRASGSYPALAGVTISTDTSGYLASIHIGTPAQTVKLILDSGSPLTWLSSSNISALTPSGSSAGSTTQQLQSSVCRGTAGCFTASSSSSFSPLVGLAYQITYVDTSVALGTIVQDVATWAGLNWNMTFGLCSFQYDPVSTGITGGILGLSPVTALAGYSSLTAAVQSSITGTTAGTAYAFNSPTILTELVRQGVLASQAYSLYLDDKGSGNVLLGGVDAAKYQGNLIVLPITSPTQNTLQVQLVSIGVNGSASTTAVAATAVLDSGTTLTYLPAGAVSAIASSIGGTVQNSQVYYQCNTVSSSTTVDFHFQNNAVIRAPVSLLIDLVSRSNGVEMCRLGIVAQAISSYYLLGDTFLRSAYVVFNFDQAQIAIAQIRYSSATNVTAIGKGTFGIPHAIYNSSSPGAVNSLAGNASSATTSGSNSMVSQPWSALAKGAPSNARSSASRLTRVLWCLPLIAGVFILTV
ncbi:Candidapepsin-3 [Savitreella phatthalungensis]